MTNVTLTANQVAVLEAFTNDPAYAIGDLGSTYTDSAELAANTGKSKQSVNATLGHLMDKGLVESDPEEDNAVSITVAGCQWLLDNDVPLGQYANVEEDASQEEVTKLSLDANFYNKEQREFYLAEAEAQGWTRSRARRAWRKVHGSMYA